MAGRTERKSTPLPQRLQELRAAMPGVSMQDVADALDIPKGTYANWEMNRADPPLAMLVPLANFFGVSLENLLGVKENLVADRLSHLIVQLSDTDRLAVEQILKTMTGAGKAKKPRSGSLDRTQS